MFLKFALSRNTLSNLAPPISVLTNLALVRVVHVKTASLTSPPLSTMPSSKDRLTTQFGMCEPCRSTPARSIGMSWPLQLGSLVTVANIPAATRISSVDTADVEAGVDLGADSLG